MKRNRVVSIAWADSDKAAANRVRKMAGPFAPSVSFLLLLFFRHSLDRVIQGEISLEALCQKYANADLEDLEVTGAIQ
jgi:hypothetical protein